MKDPTEEVRRICFDAWVVGYFANAQYDVLFLLHVILNAVKNPTEEVRRICFDTLVVGYFANAQYDVKAQVGYFACAQYDVICFERKPKKLLYYLVKRRNLVFFDRFL